MNNDTRATAAFRAARDILLENRTELDHAHRLFTWPELTHFNWALDWFDVIASDNARPAVRVLSEQGEESISFQDLAVRSDQVATWLRGQGVQRGDRILICLHNGVALWETILAGIKLGAVLVPTYPSAPAPDLADRIRRAEVRHVITEPSLTAKFRQAPKKWTPICTGRTPRGWIPYEASRQDQGRGFEPDGRTRADDPLFCYFTSGTTSLPKMVVHTHTSYPVGHLSGMYWNGLRPGDLHLNISAPGWAKHAWSSFFVPFNAEATVLAFRDPTPRPEWILTALRASGVTAFCAPPTVWRGMLAAGLGPRPTGLREATSAGEPLEASLIDTVRTEWGVWVRDGYGQTETTCQVGNPPGRVPEPGMMGWPMPGYRMRVIDDTTGRPAKPGAPGVLCVDLADRPAGMMAGYLGDPEQTGKAFAGGLYRTGDLVTQSDSGAFSYQGRDDDMFKSFDHRIAPLELETALLGHPAVAQAAVVPAPHEEGLFIPKAFVVLAGGCEPDEETARCVLAHAATVLPPEKMIKAIHFTDALPTTISGKVQRSVLRDQPATGGHEFEPAT
ncbi:AMP-dependent synthetase [Streptomyces antnestii]|uniref:AMP-dependent synthetase n=1 Tax=Streptomyces antnestii TaxID=2494256 RepID=A0A437PF94_9ACTN|nr:AMP-binding protein [Streptomyces sp. San01]RVU20956.1 AMP-dependent synthetase [Streptomyces sp. San01]